MGHEINYLTFKVKGMTTTQIQDACDDYARHRSDSRSGLYNDVRFIEKTFDTYDDAYAYIEEHDTYSYCQMAVKYKEYDIDRDKLNKQPKSLIKAKEIRDKTNEQLLALKGNYHFANHKAALITCQSCGSKIANSYMTKRNDCPVCRTDMRPKTIKDKIDALEIKYRDAVVKYSDEYDKHQAKCRKNFEECWLVKIEYHV